MTTTDLNPGDKVSFVGNPGTIRELGGESAYVDFDRDTFGEGTGLLGGWVSIENLEARA